ncbi:putative bromodomain-containing protein [Cucumis melo var. makuwa]|uniref:Bromodomain-containing protein n=1 Tax=Cucumis melo var. makuwa TaxID=1194695 RepID=A0A5D3BPN5_CUCMM|nr:putative bromodomain-containing protein [Cucumis melo var. makuwa]TYK01000.1 putative bromodomain-containing protein [Cucumis melo var. makuwa]
MYCVGKASPDKLYRAALLRNLFADTILKAREKHLKRMEREELERQQREGWRRATDGGRLKLKLQSRRWIAAADGNDDGRDGDELRIATNVSLFSEPFPFRFQFYVKQKRNNNQGISRRTTYGVEKT